MLGEFFLAHPDEVESYLESGPDGRTETLTAKTVSDVSIAALGEILGTGTYDELIDRLDAGAHFAPDDESGIFDVPSEISTALTGADRADVAAKWLQTEEMEGWSASEAQEV